jgi:hypothetical protein
MKRSTLLTCIGAVGVIVTSIATAKVTPKAVLALEEAKAEKGEELTALEKVKVAGPVYIPPVALGLSTIACIFSANMLDRRTQASMAGAYALLDNSYKEYKRKLKDIYGEDADSKIKEAIAKEQYDEQEELPEGTHLFFDYNSGQYFNATMDEVLQKFTTDDGLEGYIISMPWDVPWYENY